MRNQRIFSHQKTNKFRNNNNTEINTEINAENITFGSSEKYNRNFNINKFEEINEIKNINKFIKSNNLTSMINKFGDYDGYISD